MRWSGEILVLRGKKRGDLGRVLILKYQASKFLGLCSWESPRNSVVFLLTVFVFSCFFSIQANQRSSSSNSAFTYIFCPESFFLLLQILISVFLLIFIHWLMNLNQNFIFHHFSFSNLPKLDLQGNLYFPSSQSSRFSSNFQVRLMKQDHLYETSGLFGNSLHSPFGSIGFLF